MKNRILSLLVLLVTAASCAWAQDEYPIVYDFDLAAYCGENPANKNGSAANGQAFYAWENEEKTDSKRQDYKGYEYATGSVLPKVCHVWRRSDRIDGNVSCGGLKCPSNKEMAIDGLSEGLTVTIIYDASDATDKKILWAIGDGTATGGPGQARAKATINGAEAKPGETTIASGDVITINSVTPAENGTGYIVFAVKKGMVIKKIIIDVAPAAEMTPVAENQWEFNMPGSNVVLTPVYAEATLTRGAGTTDESETAYASLKEAFKNVRTGDVIKLDWDVTLTEELQTRTTGSGVEFTLDFNGYTISGPDDNAYVIYLANVGDELTLTDNSDKQQKGGIKGFVNAVSGSKFVFDGGNYMFANGAAYYNDFCANANSILSLAPGKEFVDIENAPADAFNMFVDYKAFELTIGSGRFATFYADQNITLTEGTDVSFYTIKEVNTDLATATVTPINIPVIPADTPMLVYNGNATADQQTVKLKVNTEPVDVVVDHASEFQGTAEPKTFDDQAMAAADYYVLSGGKAFAPVYEPGTIGANKCWIELDHDSGNGSAPARQLNIVFDGGQTTGISVVSGLPADADAIYDLNGRKLNAAPTRKGVYVKDGKKVVK